MIVTMWFIQLFKLYGQLCMFLYNFYSCMFSKNVTRELTYFVLKCLMPSRGEEHLVCTCEHVLAQGGRTTVFAVEEVLRGRGALEVLHGQTVTQDVLLQVRAGPKLRRRDMKWDRNQQKVFMFDVIQWESSSWSERLRNLRAKNTALVCMLNSM